MAQMTPGSCTLGMASNSESELPSVYPSPANKMFYYTTNYKAVYRVNIHSVGLRKVILCVIMKS